MTYRYDDDTEITDTVNLDDTLELSDNLSILNFIELLLGITGEWVRGYSTGLLAEFKTASTTEVSFKKEGSN